MKDAFIKSVLKLQESEQAFAKDYNLYINSLAPLDPNVFWTITADYCNLLLQNLSLNYLDNKSSLKYAIDEVCRLAMVKKVPYTLEQIAQFAKNWRLFSAKFDDVIYFTIDRSDDGCSDLFDNLPLCGCEFFEEVIENKYKNKKSLERAICKCIADSCVNLKDVKFTKKIKDFILNGENYHYENITESVTDYLRIDTAANNLLENFMQAEKD